MDFIYQVFWFLFGIGAILAYITMAREAGLKGVLWVSAALLIIFLAIRQLDIIPT